MQYAPIVVSQHFNCPPADVWAALTNPFLMRGWYFDLPDFKPEKGFRFQFTGGPPETVYLHLCEVTEAIAEKRIAYTWRYDGYAGCSTVIFDLAPDGAGTMLTLIHNGLETFPQDNPDLAAENFATGWDQIIHENLASFLARKI